MGSNRDSVNNKLRILFPIRNPGRNVAVLLYSGLCKFYLFSGLRNFVRYLLHIVISVDFLRVREKYLILRIKNYFKFLMLEKKN